MYYLRIEKSGGFETYRFDGIEDFITVLNLVAPYYEFTTSTKYLPELV